MTTNPLLVPIDSLIDYPAIQPEHIEQAVDQLLALARQAIDTVSNDDSEPSWDNIVEPITDATETLYRAWSVAGHLNSVINTPELRTVYNQCLPRMSEFSTWVGLNRPLFLRYQALADSPAFAALTPQRQRIITLALRDFRLSGVQLEGQAREDYARISEELAQTSQQFSEHVLDAIDQWHYLVSDQAELDGIPDDVLAAAQRAAQENDQQGWRLTLKMPCYLPVMQYARNQTLRELMYRAYTTIASDQGDAQFDNSQAIETLLDLRAQEASLLGFASYAHMRLETRMADTPEQVMSFLRDLASKARPYARQDLDELQAFAQKELGLETLQAWDVPFSAERLREQRYAYSEDEVKQYFTEPAVLSGLFKVIQRLFDVTLRAADVPAWHPAVRPFEV
ncbi:MAG: M3 family metallopeptidase, partial [Alcaligenes aquatilis]